MFGIVLVGSLVGVATAVGAFASLLTAVAALRGVKAVHVIVNSANKALVARIEQLAHALQDSGVKIPDSPEE
jgi:uncharacterized membrane protein required for colicin V production